MSAGRWGLWSGTVVWDFVCGNPFMQGSPLTRVVLNGKEHFAKGTQARPVVRTQVVALGHMTGHMTITPNTIGNTHTPSPVLGEHA